jgi:putative transposase
VYVNEHAIAYLNVSGTFYYLCSILDSFGRMIVHGEIRAQKCEHDIEIIRQRAKERYPQATPRIISDNGPPFIAKDFKESIRLMVCPLRAPRHFIRSTTASWSVGASH